MQKLHQSPEGLARIVTHHLRYEVQMLRYTRQRLRSKFSDEREANVFIEAYCIHARNLIDFLRDEKKLSEGDRAAAFHFADGYSPFDGKDFPGVLYGKLSEQIAHITYGRTKADEENINAAERELLFELIENEIPIFVRHLKQPYQGLWQDPDVSTVNAGGLLQATSTSLPETFVATIIPGHTGAAGPQR